MKTPSNFGKLIELTGISCGQKIIFPRTRRSYDKSSFLQAKIKSNRLPIVEYFEHVIQRGFEKGEVQIEPSGGSI